MTAPKLGDLLERLEAATGPDREIDLALLNGLSQHGQWRWLDHMRDAVTWDEYGPNAAGNPVCSWEPYTASLDAVLTLVEEKLPGWRAELTQGVDYWSAGVVNSVEAHVGAAPTPSLALLKALVSALSTESGEKGIVNE